MPVQVRTAYHMYQWLWSSLDWLYPPRCGGCGAIGSRWCADCQAGVRLVQAPVCVVCGAPEKAAGICGKCSRARPTYRVLRSWADFYGPLRGALHRLKYKRDVALGEILARPLVNLFDQAGWVVDAVLPVPMSKKHLAERGYNQAALLAQPLALAAGLAYRPGWISKARETRSQVGLSIKDRKENVAGAFVAAGQKIHGKCILLVDDVTTTGATLDECAKSLISAGAGEVYCLTLARAV